jgi:HSP20 family molecular chaperone IbpA
LSQEHIKRDEDRRNVEEQFLDQLIREATTDQKKSPEAPPQQHAAEINVEEEEKRKLEVETRMKDEEGLMRIHRVEEESRSIETDIKDLANVTTVITSKAKNDPEIAAQFFQDILARVSKYGNSLERDLNTLDELVGLHAARDEKKREVRHIQSLLDEVEHMKASLKVLRDQMAAETEAQHKERESQEKQNGPADQTGKQTVDSMDLDEIAEEELKHLEETEETASTIQQKSTAPTRRTIPITSLPPGPVLTTASETAVESRKRKRDDAELMPIEGDEEVDEEEEASGEGNGNEEEMVDARSENIPFEDIWLKLRLDLRLRVHEDVSEYSISGSLPGVDEKELQISVEPNRVLVISGIRRPSDSELDQMRKTVRDRFPDIDERQEKELIIRLAVGRFGRFDDRYRIPTEVRPDLIKAKFSKGQLMVTLPKTPQSQKQTPRDVPSFDSRVRSHFPREGYRSTPFFSDPSFFW